MYWSLNFHLAPSPTPPFRQFHLFDCLFEHACNQLPMRTCICDVMCTALTFEKETAVTRTRLHGVALHPLACMDPAHPPPINLANCPCLSLLGLALPCLALPCRAAAGLNQTLFDGLVEFVTELAFELLVYVM